jgi:hypothetical protein
MVVFFAADAREGRRGTGRGRGREREREREKEREGGSFNG